MQLPGRLARTTLGDLLGSLHREGATGVLELSAGVRRHRVHLERGYVAGVDLDVASPPARLGELIVDEGLAAVADVARALSLQQLRGDNVPTHGEILVRAGVLTAEVRDAVLRRQSRVRLDALFTMLDARDAGVRFHVGVSAKAFARRASSTATPLSPSEFLRDRPRARDDLRAQTPAPARAASASGPRPVEKLRALRMLGLAPGADGASIRRAFRAAAARVHPDRHQALPAVDRSRLQSILVELSAAYHLLCA